MCSSTRGPAIAPSLVTWPTSTSANPRDLASRISSKLDARTWLTLPGALSTLSSHMVWIELMTTRPRSRSPSRVGGDVAHVDRRGKLERRVGQTEPARPQPDLIDRLLARHVADPLARPRQRRRGLQHEGGLADAGIAADQHDRRRHEPAAQHAVELGDPDDRPRRRLGRTLQPDERDTLARASPRRPRPGLDRLLDQRIPLPTRFAPPDPLRVSCAAVLADEA